MKILSTSQGVYRYRLHGRVEELPLRPNHYWNGEVGGGISSLSYPEVVRRGVRRVTYVFKGRTWVGLYRREADGRFHLSASYGYPNA
jgi:hypothetical protein